MKYLVVKTSALGDIVQAFDVLPLLHQADPKAEVHWAVDARFSSLPASHPLIAHTLSLPLKPLRPRLLYKTLSKERYNWIFDLQGNMKSGLVTLLARGKRKVGYQYRDLPEWPNFLATNQRVPVSQKSARQRYLDLVQHALGIESLPPLSHTLQPQGKVETLHPSLALCFGAAWKNKRLPPPLLLRLLRKLPCKQLILLWGSEEEKRAAEQLKRELPHALLWPKSSPAELQALFSSCDGVLAMDSFLLHLAGTTSTPTFGLFGPSSANYYAPKGCTTFQGSCPYNVSFKRRCPYLRSCKTGACLRQPDWEALESKVLEWWECR